MVTMTQEIIVIHQFGISTPQISTSNASYGGFAPFSRLMAAYEPGDLRRKATVMLRVILIQKLKFF
jgi:hypothetical protein